MNKKLLLCFDFMLSLGLILDHFCRFPDWIYTIYIGIYFILFTVTIALYRNRIPIINKMNFNKNTIGCIVAIASFSMAAFKVIGLFFKIPKGVDNMISYIYVLILTFIFTIAISKKFTQET